MDNTLMAQNLPVTEGYNNLGGNFLTRAISGLGNYVNKNPEQFAITADMIGSRMAPGNPFAGVGQYLGQSSLANKAKKKSEENLSALQKIIAGLTEGNAAGGNKVTISRGPEGRLKFDSSINLSSDGLGSTDAPIESSEDSDELGILKQFLVE